MNPDATVPQKRPLPLTIICIVGLIVGAFYFGSGLLILIDHHFNGLLILKLVPSTLFVLTFVGYWLQRRWGLLAAALILPGAIVSQVIVLAIIGIPVSVALQTTLPVLTMPLLVCLLLCAVGVAYWKRLR